MVTGLTATMILGITGIFILMALRLTTPAAPPLPDQIALPAGITATGFTQTPSYIAITAQDRILIYAPDGTTLRQTIKLTQP